ncbi:SusD/RagB family nutrient-binding outer membrane lipoprotein [Imperialibacter sp.]|uniref:SusD/RagB family nutrient-binding outer membrane lipoprotein n=1 Tax=Imperialibacter sp. TaxID=2038411 RepID=UPI0032ED0216
MMKARLIFFSLFIFAGPACQDINIDPNAPSMVEPRLLLPRIQTETARILSADLNMAQHGFMGTMSFYDDFNMRNQSWNSVWEQLYTGPMADIQKMVELTQDNSPHYNAIALIYKAYLNTTLVDLWGDVPVNTASANNGSDANPRFFSSAEIYDDAFAQLDKAITKLEEHSPVIVEGDFIYGGNPAKWKKLANSLKLKLLMSTRLINPNIASDIKKLLQQELIEQQDEDFQFQFSNIDSGNEDHPWYRKVYVTGNQFPYISYQFMYEMLRDKDPRLPFYFRRQTGDYKAVISSLKSPTSNGGCSYFGRCYKYLAGNPEILEELFGENPTEAELTYLGGFFGRDRADPNGIPNDFQWRLMPGVYPAGGYYDTDVASVPAPGSAPGGGIFPMLTSVNVKFYLLEASILGYIELDEPELLEAVIRNHIGEVVSFGEKTDFHSLQPQSQKVDDYVDLWLQKFEDQVDPRKKLDVMAKQMWFCSWGNTYHAYNLFRRSGFPSSLQPPLQLPRQFALRLPYPQTELDLNTNASTYSEVVYDRDPIFWDTFRFQF